MRCAELNSHAWELCCEVFVWQTETKELHTVDWSRWLWGKIDCSVRWNLLCDITIHVCRHQDQDDDLFSPDETIDHDEIGLLLLAYPPFRPVISHLLFDFLWYKGVLRWSKPCLIFYQLEWLGGSSTTAFLQVSQYKGIQWWLDLYIPSIQMEMNTYSSYALLL